MNKANTYKPEEQTKTIQWSIAFVLLIVMAVTRGGYVPHLQDASWAVFFLAGFYLRNYIGLPLLILAAIGIDFAMIAARGGHQDYYLTPSYLFIIPAYSTLWFAGRFFANRYSESLKGLLTFVGAAVVGIIACDLISSGGFYWMSSDAVELSMAEFFRRFIEFIPLYLKSTLLYLGVVTILHISIIQARKLAYRQQSLSS